MATTYLTVRQSMKRGMMPAATPDNPMGQSQKYMAYIMPFFALSGLYWPFGLVLYWVTTNLWTLGQQWVLFRRYPVDAAGPVADGGRPRPAPPRASPLTARRGPGPGSNGRRGNGSGGSASQPRTAGRRPSRRERRPAAATAARRKAASGDADGRPGGRCPGRRRRRAAMLRRFGRASRAEPEPAAGGARG